MKRVYILQYIKSLLLPAILLLYTNCTFTPWGVDLVQNVSQSISDTPVNSYSPRTEKYDGIDQKSGFYKKTQVPYAVKGDSYYLPNSFLDIYYCTDDPETAAAYPTLFFVHGGCFWWGDNTTGNPIIRKDLYPYVQAIIAEGFNMIIFDYAVSPQYIFPSALKQMNQALQFLKDNEDTYKISLDNLIIGGNSAGAVISSQYITAVCSPAYMKAAGLPAMALSPEQIKCAYIDDGFWDWVSMDIGTQYVAGNYMNRTIYLGAKKARVYNCVSYIKNNYPPTCLVAASFPAQHVYFQKKLKQENIDCLIINPNWTRHANVEHCYLIRGVTGKDKNILKEFNQLINFMKQNTSE